MKRNYSAVLSLLLAGGICCTGCAKTGGEATAAQKLGGSFTTEMTMTMEDWTAAGTLSRLGDGAWSVSFAEPATLAGVVLDFSGVTFMDSSGIAVALHTLQQMKQLGGKMRITNSPMQVKKVFAAAGIQKMIGMEDVT